MENTGLHEQIKPNVEEKFQNEPSEKKNPGPRRPRMKEVSSRFMSPVSSSSSSCFSAEQHQLAAPKFPFPKPSIPTEFHSKRSQPAQRRYPNSTPISVTETSDSAAESSCSADENRPDIMVRSSDQPLRSAANVVNTSSEMPFVFQSKGNLQRKCTAKLFKENGENPEDSRPPNQMSLKFNHRKVSANSRNQLLSRSVTPIVMGSYNRTPKSMLTGQNSLRSIDNGVVSGVNTAAVRLVQSNGLAAKRNGAHGTRLYHGSTDPSNSSDSETSVHVNSANLENGFIEIFTDNVIPSDGSEIQTRIPSNQGGFCDSPPIPVQSCKSRQISDFRSSMPDADLLPTMSARLLVAANSDEGNPVNESSRVSAASPCYRSLNSALSNCQESFSPTKSICKSSVLSKFNPSPRRINGYCLPPQPSNTKIGSNNCISSVIKLGADAKKGTKLSNHQGDHSLRLLQNYYLQWRFVNARAESAMNAQRITAEGSFHGVAAKISELQSSVMRKRIEFAQLKKAESLCAILEGQMPYLDEWTNLEGSYLNSLLGATKALQDATLRLPIIGNVRVDSRQLSEALNSSTDVLEALSPYVGSFLPKVEEMNSVASVLAGMVSTERSLLEECGDLLSRAQILQIEECSLRAQLIQLNRSSSKQPKEINR